MYQLGLMYIYNRWSQFEWMIIMNDQMVGPFYDNYKQYLDETVNLGSNNWLTSVWGGCCVRSFIVAYHKSLIATKLFHNYWNRMHFACEKLGAMFMGEGLHGKLGWKNCQTVTNIPIGKNMNLQRQIDLYTPFIYREAFEILYAQKTNAELFQWIESYKVKFHLEHCNL